MGLALANRSLAALKMARYQVSHIAKIYLEITKHLPTVLP